MNINRLRIGHQLGLGFALVLALAALTTLTGIWRLSTVAEEASVMMADPLVKERLAHEWFRNITAGVKRTTALAKSTDLTLEPVFADEIKATTARTNEVFEQLTRHADADEKRQLERSAELRKVFLAARLKVLDAKKGGLADEADRIFANEFLTSANAYLASVQAFQDGQVKSIDQAGVLLQANARQARLVLGGLGAAALLVSILLAVQLTRSITRPMVEAAGLARRVADGDLTRHPAPVGDSEVAVLVRALVDMQGRLAGVVSQVRDGVQAVGTASHEIASGNQDLSQRTELTASALQKTAGATTQLAVTVNQTAASARTAQQLATSASAVAQRGGEVVAHVVSTMNQIHHSSQKIADIIGVIDGIAFQTNILALNAAVEAARAGEQGRGFAVVASEVRSLAQRSAEAAKEIKALIGASVGKVESGAKLVADAGSTMNEIVASVQRVTDIIGEISTAAGEQSAGIGQVNASVNELDGMTQQNAALVEESAAAAESLKTQADRLNGLVAGFRLDVGFFLSGAGLRPAAPAPPAPAARLRPCR